MFLSILGGVGLGITYGIHLHLQNQSLLNMTVDGGKYHRPVFVSSDSFMSSTSIDISLSNPGTKSTALYKTLCKNLTLLTDRSLPPQHIPQLRPGSFIRDGYNYDVEEDVPINLAPGSSLTYTMNANSTSSDPGCLRLYLFDSYSAYNSFLGPDNNTVNNYVARSHCINVSTSGPPAQSVIVFNITDKQANYYVAVETPGQIAFDANVSVIQTYYDISGLKMPCSYRLSSRHPSCVIDRCTPHKVFCFEVKKSNVCFLVVSNDPVNMTYQTKMITHTRTIFYTFLAMMAMILLIIILIVCLISCCCYCQCKRKNRTNISKSEIVKSTGENKVLDETL